VETEMADGIKL